MTTLPEYDPAVMGCVARTGYAHTIRPAGYMLQPMAGRPVHRRREPRPHYVTNLTFHYRHDQFAAWQSFWEIDLQQGLSWFVIPLVADSVANYDNGLERYTVHALGPYEARLEGEVWVVTLDVEHHAPLTARFGCDDIWGGPITSPAPDDIWGGPITDLAPDVIDPCPGVL